MRSPLDAFLKVANVDQLMALVGKLEAQLAASRSISEKLIAAAVAELVETKNPIERA